jgi:hypothetical protein
MNLGLGLGLSFSSRKSIVILPPNEIFGDNLYDWWDFTDNSTLSLTGSAINSVSSKKSGSTRAFVASGGARPTIVANQVNSLQVARFDGLASFMEVATSTALYNFLHNATGGTVIVVYKKTSEINNERILTNRRFFADAGPGIIVSSNITSTSIIILNNSATSGLREVAVSSASQVVYNFNSFVGVSDVGNAIVSDRATAIVNNIIGGDNIQTNAFSALNSARNFTIGKVAGAADNYFTGDIAEIIISQNQPTLAQLTQIETYLTSKYGTFPIT